MSKIHDPRAVLAAFLVLLGCGGGAATVSAAAPTPAAEPDPAPAPAVQAPPAADVEELYTEAQARRGSEVYDRVCLECHTRVEFTERPFLFAWEGTSVAQVYRYIAENMPDDGPGSLPERDYLDAMAFILEMNGYPAGSEELTAADERMSAVPFEKHGTGRP